MAFWTNWTLPCRCLAVLLLGWFLTFAAAAAAQAAPAWLAPGNLRSPVSTSLDRTHVASDPAGNTIALWSATTRTATPTRPTTRS
jgi:hypothetical protein